MLFFQFAKKIFYIRVLLQEELPELLFSYLCIPKQKRCDKFLLRLLLVQKLYIFFLLMFIGLLLAGSILIAFSAVTGVEEGGGVTIIYLSSGLQAFFCIRYACISCNRMEFSRGSAIPEDGGQRACREENYFSNNGFSPFLYTGFSPYTME